MDFHPAQFTVAYVLQPNDSRLQGIPINSRKGMIYLLNDGVFRFILQLEYWIIIIFDSVLILVK